MLHFYFLSKRLFFLIGIVAGLSLALNAQTNFQNKEAEQIPPASNCDVSPYPTEIIQPNGNRITIVGKGNMVNQWTETTDGYTIALNNAGVYEYAQKTSRRLSTSGVKANDPGKRTLAEINHLSSISKSITPDFDPLKSSILNQVNAQINSKSFPTTGNIRVLALLIDYPDLVNKFPKEDFDSLLYAENYRNGDESFKTFYETASNGQLKITVDVYGWYRADSNYIWYSRDSGSSRAADLVREAVDAAEVAGVDFSLYDNDNNFRVDGILAVHSGPGAEQGSQTQYIWSHRWVLNGGSLGSVIYDGVTINDYMINPEIRTSGINNNLVGIGVFCHEFGHNLGLPDLYDTDPNNGTSAGIGEWGLMASAGWLGGEHQPGNFCAWSKEELGWVNPQVLVNNHSGIYSLDPASRNINEMFRINTSLANEYFLIENRQKTGLDTALKGNGLAIWHINTDKTGSFGNSVNADESLKGVDLEEADGLAELDSNFNRADNSDLFPGNSNNQLFDDSSNPNAKTYTNANTNIEIRDITETGNIVSFGFGPAPGAPCSGSTVLTAASGTFDDGNDTLTDYAHNQNCSWLIQIPSGTVTLSFSFFDTQTGADTLNIYDGSDSTANLLGSFSGNSIPAPISSSGTDLFIQFQSDSTITSPGWSASYVTNPAPGSCATDTLTSASETFHDGSGPSQNYADNLNCSWLIQPVGASLVELIFDSISTELGIDTISVFDGDDSTDPLIGTYSGTQKPGIILSSDTSLYVEFKSNGSITDKGFQISYRGISGCSGTTDLTAASGSFTDGTSQNETYVKNLDCEWLIKPANALSISLDFTRFDIEQDFDFVEVFDGSTTSAPLLGSFTGKNIPNQVVSTGGTMLVRFTTDISVNAFGWSATYSSTNTHCSQNTSLTSIFGSFSDGSDTNDYINSLSCSWVIQPPSADSVTLRFDSFDTDTLKDIVYIYDGTDNTGTLLASYSGSAIPDSVVAHSGEMFVEFITDDSIRAAGWTATYTSNNAGNGCSGTTTFTSSSGSFTDGSGVANYLPNITCGWLIDPLGTPAVITFTMDSINLSFGDFVRVFDGSSNAGTLIGTFFFTNTGFPVSATSGQMFVEFTSNGFFEQAGWGASYTTSNTFCIPQRKLTANSGFFNDGSGFGNNYSNNSECSWLIQPSAPNRRVRLNSIFGTTQATHDTITIYDGDSESDSIMRTLAGNFTAFNINASGGSVLITFKTNATVRAAGWNVNYTSTLLPTCNGLTNLTDPSGTFTDGSVDNIVYTQNNNCSWLIQPAGASRINLNFNRFDTEPGKDVVSVYDGTSAAAPLIGQFSGGIIPKNITSSTGSLFVRFTTNNTINETGWEASYTSSSDQCFNSATLTASRDTIEDGSDTLDYTNNLNCEWLIQPPSATSISLEFFEFDLAAGDTITMYNGSTNSSPRVGRYVGPNSTPPPVLLSTAGSMLIEFTTNASDTAAGWKATYTSTNSNSCSGVTLLTAPTGSFSDGSGTANYDNNLNCGWLIQPPGASLVGFQLDSMTMGTGDVVNVYDGPDNLSPLIRTYTSFSGTLTKALSGSMYVEFITNHNNTDKGWSGSYSSSSTFCLSNTVFTAPVGNFDDGSALTSQYKNNTDCQWLIQPTNPNVFINLRFFTIRTELNRDTITVYNGSTTSDSILGTFSGTRANVNVNSTGSEMLVTFKSNGSITSTGWRANYRTVSIPLCAGTSSITAPTGTFNDGSDNGTIYAPNTNCTWLIEPTNATKIDLSFNYFETQASVDLLSVYDGSSSAAPLLGTFSGSTLPSSLTANSGKMFLEFTTNGILELNGWEVSYTADILNTLSASPDTIFIADSVNSTGNYTITSNATWTTGTGTPWFGQSPDTANSNGSVTVSATQANLSLTDRFGKAYVDLVNDTLTDTVVIVQRGATPFVEASPDSLFFNAVPAGSQSISINSNVNWSTSSNIGWVSFTPSAGSGNGSITVNAQINTASSIRNGYIVLTGSLGASNDTVFIVQDSAITIPSTLSAAPDTVFIADTVNSIGLYNINSNTTWVTATSAPWFVQSPDTANGNGTVTVTATQANLSLTSRSEKAYIDLVNDTLTDTVIVVQRGASPILEANPDSLFFNAVPIGSQNILINSNVNWTASANVSWVSFSPTNGTGSSSIVVNAQINTINTIRNGYIVLTSTQGAGNDTIFIEQDSAITVPPTLSASPDTVFVDDTVNSTGLYNISSNTTWATGTASTWFSQNPDTANGNGMVTVTVLQANLNLNSRYGKAYIDLVSGNLTDTVIVAQKGANPILEANPDSLFFGVNPSGTQNASIVSNVNWTASPNVAWISVLPSIGSGNGTMAVSAMNNGTGQIRNGFIVLSSTQGANDDTIFVYQDTLSIQPPSLSVSPKNLSLAQGSGSTGNFTVNSTVVWQTSAGATWLSVNNPANTSDTNTVQVVTNSMNVSTNPRSTFVAVQDINGTLFDTVFVSQLGGTLLLSVSPKSILLNQNAGSIDSVGLTSNLSWNASSGAAWLDVNPKNGTGDDSLGISSFSANNSTSTRSSFIELADLLGNITDTVFVTQEGVPEHLNVDPKTISLAQTSGSTSNFTVNSNVSWQVLSGSTWLTVTGPVNQFDTNTVQITANSANTSANPRSTYVAVQDINGTLFDTVSVQQFGTSLIVLGTPDTLLIGGSIGSSGIVQVNSNTSWISTSSASWFSISPDNGTGNSTINITATANNSGPNRRSEDLVIVDTLNAVSDTVIIIQDTIPAGLTISPDTIRLGASIGSLSSFDITTPSNWTALPDASWIDVTPTSSSGNFTVTVRANTSNTSLTERQSFITVSISGDTDTVYVIQEAASPIMSADPSEINLNFTAGSNDVIDVSSNIEWTVINPVNWLTINPDSGNGDGSFNVTANTANLSGLTRTANLTLRAINVNSLPDRIVTVNQIDGSVPNFAVSKDTVFVDYPQGSTGTFSILSNINNWSLSEVTPWLLVNPTSGSNTSAISILVASRNNFGNNRSAEITVSAPGFPDTTVTVIQRGSPAQFQISPANVILGPDSTDSAFFNISSNLMEWTISENSSWMEATPVIGAFSRRIKIMATEENNTNNIRTDILTINAPPLVPQSIIVTQDTARITSINDQLLSEDKISIYPNPTRGEITLNIPESINNISDLDIRMYSILGKEINVPLQALSSNTFRINLNGNSKGIYLLKLVYKDKMITKRISLIGQ